MRPQVSRRTPLYFLAAQSSDSACGISASSNILFTQLTVPSALSAPVRARRKANFRASLTRQRIGGAFLVLRAFGGTSQNLPHLHMPPPTTVDGGGGDGVYACMARRLDIPNDRQDIGGKLRRLRVCTR